MPKIKSHKAAQKRIGVTGSGKFKRVNAWTRPPPRDQVVPTDPTLRRQVAIIGPEHAKQVRRLLPYL